MGTAAACPARPDNTMAASAGPASSVEVNRLSPVSSRLRHKSLIEGVGETGPAESGLERADGPDRRRVAPDRSPHTHPSSDHASQHLVGAAPQSEQRGVQPGGGQQLGKPRRPRVFDGRRGPRDRRPTRRSPVRSVCRDPSPAPPGSPRLRHPPARGPPRSTAGASEIIRATSSPTAAAVPSSTSSGRARMAARIKVTVDRMRSGPLRSKPSSEVTCRQPSPTLPNTSASATNTSSKVTSLKWCSPPICTIGSMVIPG